MAINQPNNQASEAPRGAWVLIAYFLALLVMVPVVQLCTEVARREPIQELSVLKHAPTLEHFQGFERQLEDSSVVAEAARMHCQWIGLLALKTGNREALMGRDGWMFYRTSLNSVIGRGFMDGPGEEGHPLDAIVRFRDSLEAQGVKLTLLIVPGKEKIYPNRLTRSGGGYPAPPANVDTDEFLSALSEAGVDYVDATQVLWNAKRGGSDLYLRMDTHWTPDGCAVVADAVATALPDLGPPTVAMRLEAVDVANRGDLYDMLDLPALPTPCEPQTVTVHRIIDAGTGEPVEPDPDSPIVLLGDSFTNVYSVEEMGWGDHAGLGEQLAYRLGHRIDVIAQNDGGVNTARATLARSPGGLVGKKHVIWQFAARDLVVSNGDWKRIDIAPR